MKKYDALIAGYICLDLVPDFRKYESISGISNLVIPGNLIEIDEISFSLGGLVANTGIAFNKFDGKVYLNGLIGNDSFGKIHPGQAILLQQLFYQPFFKVKIPILVSNMLILPEETIYIAQIYLMISLIGAR
jgi:hypothetical protein